MNNFFTITYVIFLVLYLSYRYGGKARGINKEKQKEGKVYSNTIYIAQYIVYVSHTLFCVVEYFLAKREINLFVSALGLVILLTGTFSRKFVIQHLGKQWSPRIEIKSDHQLVTTGIYQYIRHPNSLFLFMETCGFAMIPNAYYALIVGIIITVPLTYIRLYWEEKALIANLGQEYVDYRKRVPAILPYKLINLLVNKS